MGFTAKISGRLFTLAALLLGNAYSQDANELQKLQAMIEGMKSSLEAMGKLRQADSLICVFSNGATSEWKKGQPVVTVDKMTGSNDPTIFAQIDIKANKAVMGGNLGNGPIQAFITTSGLHFLEITDSGNLMHTTVFPKFADLGNLPTKHRFYAVHSRHSFLLNHKILPSQYNGICTAQE